LLNRLHYPARDYGRTDSGGHKLQNSAGEPNLDYALRVDRVWLKEKFVLAVLLGNGAVRNIGFIDKVFGINIGLSRFFVIGGQERDKLIPDQAVAPKSTSIDLNPTIGA
jgi:hypothetical protein